MATLRAVRFADADVAAWGERLSGGIARGMQLDKRMLQVVLCTLTSVGEKHDGTNKDDPKLEEFAQVARDVAKAKACR